MINEQCFADCQPDSRACSNRQVFKCNMAHAVRDGWSYRYRNTKDCSMYTAVMKACGTAMGIKYEEFKAIEQEIQDGDMPTEIPLEPDVAKAMEVFHDAKILQEEIPW